MVSPSSTIATVPRVSAERPQLYLFSALPPQRNGLADYIAQYLEPLARDYRLVLVTDSTVTKEIAAHYAGASFEVIGEARFAARYIAGRCPESDVRVLYNLGNNRDCIFMLDFVHRYPGTVILHDVSLFYLHQIALQQQRAKAMMGRLLLEDGYKLPDYCLADDGTLMHSPSFMYQECLMVRRIVASARSVVVHSAYAHRRALGGVTEVGIEGDLQRKLCRMPHFVLPPPEISNAESVATLARWGVRADECVLVVPGFLTGNKMLYEILVAYRRLTPLHPRLRLIYAGEERPDEYRLSDKIKALWPDGNGPIVTGYLDSRELDILFNRADLSFVLRYPTYGETSGILPRAIMGGSRVVTVDIGSYAEFESDQIQRVVVGSALPAALEASIEAVLSAPFDGAHRLLRQVEARRRAAVMVPTVLYGSLRNAIEQGVQSPPSTATSAAFSRTISA